MIKTIFAMICYLALHLYRRFPCPGYKEDYPEEEIRWVFILKKRSSALYVMTTNQKFSFIEFGGLNIGEIWNIWTKAIQSFHFNAYNCLSSIISFI